jgi:hypothetical protein
VSGQLLDELLEAYAPAGGRDDLDWHDVLRRAGEPERTRARPSRRRLVVAVALAALLLFVLATPAFGLRQALLDLVGREDVSFEESPEAPLVTKRRFADLAFSRPRWLDPQVLAGDTRRLVVDIGQRERVLVIAPTRRGGFCYRLQGLGGQCQRNARTTAEMPGLTWWYVSRELSDDTILVRTVTGTVLDERIVRLILEFKDSHSVGLRFVWVSAPIRAGFFAYSVPRDRQEEARGPIAVTGLDARGNVVYRREAIEYPQPKPEVFAPRRPRWLPADPPAFLLPPFRTASDQGATIKAGQAGVVQLDVRRLEPPLRAELRGRLVTFGCFRVVTRFGAKRTVGSSWPGRLGATAGAQFHNAHPPDGCDVQLGAPDMGDYRPVLEFEFTENGRRHFVDRAAARDLAAFVSLLRREGLLDDELQEELERRESGRLVSLADLHQRPPAGRIGYFAEDDAVTLVRVSPTGHRFFVEVEDGRVVRRYLGRLAWIR